MLNWFRKKNLRDVLNETKKVKVKGVLFNIKKLDVSHYLNGSKSLLASYDTYKVGNAEPSDINLDKKVREHYRDVFLSSVVRPKLSRNNDGEDIFVDEIFQDWDLAAGLYENIISYTYGKKKMKSLGALRKSL